MSFQLLKFTEWSDSANSEKVLVLGISGDSNLVSVFEKMATDVKYRGQFEIRKIAPGATPDELSRLDAIYFSGDNLRETSRLIGKTYKLPIVLIGGFEDFLEMGGMVLFQNKQNRLTFDINLVTSKEHGIEYRAKLLRLANRVIEE